MPRLAFAFLSSLAVGVGALLTCIYASGYLPKHIRPPIDSVYVYMEPQILNMTQWLELSKSPTLKRHARAIRTLEQARLSWTR